METLRMIIRNLKIAGLALAATTMLSGAANATAISVSITNASGANGLYLTPFLSVFHDGTYRPFTVGQAASSTLETLAEEGGVAGQAAAAAAQGFKTGVATGPAGFGSGAGQPPVLDPGETGTFVIDLDPSRDLFFTFLSMVIPSNDTFLGNGNPMAYRLFDDAGNFTGLPTINVDLADVWDAGTEINNNQGAAFNTAGGVGTDENGTVQGIPTIADLDSLFGQSTAAGTVTAASAVNFDKFASIRFEQVAPVPLPAALPMLLAGLGLLGASGMRRRQKA